MMHQTATRMLDVRAGDVLEGAEGTVTTRIKLLYVSRQTVLARKVKQWEPSGHVAELGRESTWTLTCRDWRIVRRGGKLFRDGGRRAKERP